MEQRIILYAGDGKMLTDGTIHGKIIYLEKNKSAEDFYEITDAEYAEILKTNAKGEFNEDN